MSYKKALEAIRSMERKELARHAYVDATGCYCAIGAVVPRTRLLAEELSREKIISLFDHDSPTADGVRDSGMTPMEADALQSINDGFGDNAAEGHECFPASVFPPETPESRRDRYVHVLSWLEARVREEEEVSA